MLHFLPARLKGTLSFLLILINTIAISIPLMCIAVVKLLIPVEAVRAFLSKILIVIAQQWVHMNALNFRQFSRIKWEVAGLEELKTMNGRL